MKNKVSGGRVIISLCMDKERDEKLIDFLNSKPNKSDYIRNVLNEHLDMIENPPANNNESVINTLLEILSNLSLLTDKVVSLGDNRSVPPPTKSNARPSNICLNSMEEQTPSTQQCVGQEISQNDDLEDDSDMVFNNVLRVIHNT